MISTQILIGRGPFFVANSTPRTFGGPQSVPSALRTLFCQAKSNVMKKSSILVTSVKDDHINAHSTYNTLRETLFAVIER